MKKLVLVLALAAAALLGYRWFNGRRAVTVYEKFAEAWMRGNKAEAMKLGEAARSRGSAARCSPTSIIRRRSGRRRMAGKSWRSSRLISTWESSAATDEVRAGAVVASPGS